MGPDRSIFNSLDCRRSIRERVFEPAFNDALAEYMQGEQSRRQFITHTAWLVVATWGVVIGSKMTAGIAKLIRAALRGWWFLRR